MTVKELQIVYEALWNAKRCIELLACEDYPYTDFVDEDMREMFYELNRMGIKVTKKLELLEGKEQEA